MSDSRSKNRMATLIRWIARIWGSMVVAFVLLSAIGEGLGQAKPGEWVALTIFFLICVGLIVAWKWEGLGGIIAVGCRIAWHVTMRITSGSFELILPLAIMAVPGFLFLAYWLLTRGLTEPRQ